MVIPGDLDDVAAMLLAAPCAEAVFGATPEHVKDNFRYLASVVHPDHFQLPIEQATAGTAFRKLNEWKQEADRKIAAGTYGDKKRHEPPKPVLIKIPKDMLALGALIRSGDIADVYAGSLVAGQSVVVKVARSPKDNDLMERERAVLLQLDKVEPKGRRYFSEHALATINVKGRSATVLPRYSEHVTLDCIRRRAKLGLRDVSWMLRRVLEGLGHLHRQGIVHAGLIPPHLLFHPTDHGLRIIDWCYSVPIGSPAKAISKAHIEQYAPEVTGKAPLSAATDIYMAARVALGALASSPDMRAVPQPLTLFLHSCLLNNPARRPQDAWALHEELGDLLRRVVGPPKYHPLVLDAGESST